MTQLLIPARAERMFGKGRRRKRRLRTSDEIWLEMIDKITTVLDEAEHDMRLLAREYPPQVLATYLADAAETRRELEAWRREILLAPRR
jgi:hypothetical protein